MRIQIEIDTENAGFSDNWRGEIRALMVQIERLVLTGQEGKLRDTNGNAVGFVNLIFQIGLAK